MSVTSTLVAASIRKSPFRLTASFVAIVRFSEIGRGDALASLDNRESNSAFGIRNSPCITGLFISIKRLPTRVSGSDALLWMSRIH